MAIRAFMEVDKQWLDDAKGLMNHIEFAIQYTGEKTRIDTEAEMLDRLGQQPPPTGTPERKIEWETPKQHRAYFATNGFGAGIPYRRTGKLARNWVIESDAHREGWSIIVRNESRASRYVYGSLALADARAASRFQQRFHRITGWQPARKTVLNYFETVQAGFIDNMNTVIDELGTPQFRQRGITPRLAKGKS